MKMSVSAGYGLITMMYIARSDGLVLSQQIAKSCHIPFDYLIKVLQQLVRAGLLNSKRGPNGGFKLAHPASKMSYLKIIEAIDGQAHFKLGSHTEQIKGLTREIETVCNKAIQHFNLILTKATVAQTLKKLTR